MITNYSSGRTKRLSAHCKSPVHVQDNSEVEGKGKCECRVADASVEMGEEKWTWHDRQE